MHIFLELIMFRVKAGSDGITRDVDKGRKKVSSVSWWHVLIAKAKKLSTWLDLHLKQ